MALRVQCPISVVKRGCARRDERYTKSGCEEQITGDGNFKVVLCMCKTDLCNGNGNYIDAGGGKSAGNIAAAVPDAVTLLLFAIIFSLICGS